MSLAEKCPQCGATYPVVQDGHCGGCNPFTQSAAEEFRMMGPIDCANDLSVEALLRKEREKVIRECINALPPYGGEPINNPSAGLLSLTMCREALESLLPKPDRVKELVEEYTNKTSPPWWTGGREDLERFASWLLTEKGAKL